MSSTVELWILKGSPKENVVDHLMGYKKNRLFQLAEVHQVQVKKNDTKTKVLEELVPAIKEHYAADMKGLSDAEKEHLTQIKARNTDAVELNEVQDLVEKGYLFVYLDKGKMKAVLPSEWEESPTETGNASATPDVSNEYAAFFRNATTFEQIFGYINIEHLVAVWNRYSKRKLNTEEASQLLQEQNLSR